MNPLSSTRTAIVLDTNTIVSSPELLARRPPEGYRLVIPEAVLHELGRFVAHGSSQSLVDVAREAAQQGVLEISTHAPLFKGRPMLGHDVRTPADVAVLATARALADQGRVLVATVDRDVLASARDMGLEAVDPKSLRHLLASSAVASAQLEQEVRTVLRGQRRYVLIRLAIGALISLLASWAVANLDEILESVRIWGVAVLIPLVGVVLYWIRCHYRLSYGMSEVIVGSVMGIRAGIAATSSKIEMASTLLQALGGIYIVVRGMDNIQQGLANTRFAARWQSIFSDRR